MRLVLVGILALLVANPAMSQARQNSGGLGGGRATAASYGGLALAPIRQESICLINKKTKRQVCKDRAGWRKEAKRLARPEPKAD
jgi:hypothetical protein